MTFWKWSKTAATNATADSTINWAEGQAPSSVNDSARAVMAAAAKYRDDIAGALVTTGTSTAYALTTNQVFDSLAHMDGAMIAFVPHATCGATVTLAVDGLTAKPLRSAPGVELQSGTLVLGTPYVATYNNSDGAFYLRDFYVLPSQVPIGTILDYAGSTAPNTSFALAYGQAVSRTTYATLFALTSTTFGTGDGSTTFNLPDLRGRVAAGLDNMGGSAASRIGTALVTDSATINGTTLGSVGGSSIHVQTTGEIGAHSHGVTDPTHSHSLTANAMEAQVPGAGTFASGSSNFTTFNTTAAASTGISIQSAGSSTAMAWLQPTMMLGKILRII